MKFIFFVVESSADFLDLFALNELCGVIFMAHTVTDDEEDDYMSDAILAQW